MNKQILFVTTDYSYFTLPVSHALRRLGFTVKIFDYYKPNIFIRLIGLAGNFGLLDRQRTPIQVKRLTNQALIKQVSNLHPK